MEVGSGVRATMLCTGVLRRENTKFLMKGVLLFVRSSLAGLGVGKAW